MKKFLFHVSKIIIPIVLFFLVLEIAIRNIPNDYQLKKEYLDKNAEEIITKEITKQKEFYGKEVKIELNKDLELKPDILAIDSIVY